jgi:ELWxxDGT repeat protein
MIVSRKRIRNPFALLLLVAALLGWSGPASANGTVQLVKDINTTMGDWSESWCGSGNAAPVGMTHAGNYVYFSACSADENNGLYQHNLLSGATNLVKGGFNHIGVPMVIGTRVYFSAGSLSAQLWTSDGTAAGTVQLGYFPSYPYGPTQMTGSSNALYFIAADAANGAEIWKSTGTPAGTTRITTLAGNPGNLVNVAGTLFFTEDGPAKRIWKINAAGQSVVADNLAALPTSLIAAGSTLYFRGYDAANGWEVWKSVPGANNSYITTQVTTLSGSQSPENLTYVGDGYTSNVFFTALGGTYNTLYRIDVNGGLSVTQHFAPSFQASELTNLSGRLFLLLNGKRLWTVDQSGSHFVADFAYPVLSLLAGDQLYLSMNDYTLWRSDGTTAGTVKISQNLSVTTHYDSAGMDYVGGKLFFAASDGYQNQGKHGDELWKYMP